MDRELEWRIPERTRELEEANQALRESQQMLARELDAAQRLHHVATELISARGTQALYEQILDTAMAILQADFASIQRFHPEVGVKGELNLLSYRGFNAEVARIWEWIAPTSATSCGQSLRTRGRVVVPDVRNSDFMASTYDLEEYVGAGILSAQSTPLVSRSGALLGMVSTYWREPHQMTVNEVRSLDVLARLAADLIERALAEEKLSESEERFRNLADAAPVMIWVAGPDKRATFFNKRCLDFTGTTMEQKLGNGWVAYLHEEDRERFFDMYSSSIEARQEFRSVVRLRRADGEYGWVLCSGVPRYVSRGAFSGFIGSCIEITDQKLIEDGLRASEVRLMTAQHLAKIGSWERHIDGATIYWSEEMRRIFGLPATPPPDLSTFLKYVHPKDRAKVREVDAQLRSSSAPVETEYRIVRPDGELRFVRSIVEAVRGEEGLTVRITEAVQDITEQVTARERLRESEQHLKKAERLAKVGHFQWDLRTNRVSASDEMNRIFGKPPEFEPSYGGFLADLVSPDADEVQRLVQDSLARKAGHSVEYRIAHPNGDVRTISCIWEVLLDDEGEPVRLFGTCQDITDSRRAQEEAFARQKLESVGTLASGMAHDFNNLLGGVLAQAELGLAECAAGDHPEAELKGIRNVALRGSEIVRQLMIYAGKGNAAVALVDVSRIVREMLELLKVSISKRALLETDLGDGLPAVRADAAQVRQIVMNLVTNASDAIGDRDGLIRVSTKCVKTARRSPEDEWDDGTRLELTVSDNGCGMTSETQQKIFDPFFTTKSTGRGLGLAVVHGVVRDLRGSVVVTSEPGKGATFEILLPCVRDSVSEVGEALPADEEMTSSFPGATVLLVEDEGFLREGVAKMLRRTGMAVLEAADGTSALELLRNNGSEIDLILLDLTIPGASTQQILEAVSQARPGTRVILTSAYSRDVIAGAISAPQVRGFIRKPFQVDDLVKTLRNALSS